MLPGAAPTVPQRAATAPAKPKPAGARAQGASVKSAKAPTAPGVAGLVGRRLLLNGKSGLLQISGDDKMVTIEKLQLAGEGVSDPSQGCIVDIVGEKPIEATNVGRPDGLEQFEADIPACPISFDILDGAALVPSQITACVFKAADCQTSPGGLWGPDGSSLSGDAATNVKERAQAEKAMAKLLQAIQARAADSPAAANLVRDQTAFAGQRDDACRDYVKESLIGFCALRLTEARTALLETRLDELRMPRAPPRPRPTRARTQSRSKSRRPTPRGRNSPFKPPTSAMLL